MCFQLCTVPSSCHSVTTKLCYEDFFPRFKVIFRYILLKLLNVVIFMSSDTRHDKTLLFFLPLPRENKIRTEHK